jgi:hypothetical protein
LKLWALSKTFDVAANLGETELELGRHREAAGYLSFSLWNAPPSSKVEQRERTRASLEKARKQIATIRLGVNVPGASVAVDGVALDAAFVGPEIFATPGKHTIEASAAGHRAARQTVDVAAGGAADVALKLLPEERPARSKVPGLVIAGAGAAGLVAGAILFGLYEGKRAEIRDQGPLDANGKPLCVKPPSTSGGEACDAIRALGSEANTIGNAGVATLVVGGAAVAGGILYLVWPEPKAFPGKLSSRIFPVVSSGGAGVVWTGSF